MASRTVPLGTANIRTLIADLKEFARKLDDDIKVDMEQAMCAAIAEEVKSNIASIPDVDGNYLGTDSLNTAVYVLPSVSKVYWRGTQIKFVEFGTGATGLGYPGPAMALAGYHPDPTLGSWWYPDAKAGKYVLSHGLAPQAPMYNAARIARMSGYAPARAVLKGAVDAFPVR